MPQFNVEMHITNKRTITIWARNEKEAKEKAEDLVSGWNDVEECEAIDAEEQ